MNERNAPPPPDPLRFVKSLTKPNTYYPRHATDCVLGPDAFTWIEPVSSLPQAPTAVNPGGSRLPPQNPASMNQETRRTQATSQRERTHSPERNNRPRRRPYSPPTPYREYEHEYGQSRNYGHRTGRQQYRAPRYASRSPSHGGPSYRTDRRDRGSSTYHDQGGHRDGDRDAHECVDRHTSPRCPAGTPRTTLQDVINDARVIKTEREPTPAPAAASSNDTGGQAHPTIEEAQRDVRGHPCFPSTCSAQSIALSPGAAARTTTYKKKEDKRMRTVKRRATPLPGTTTRTPAPRNATELGLWATLEIHDLAAAINVLRWSASGEPSSRKFVLRIEQEFGLESARRRNEGVAHIMAQQSSSRLAFRAATGADTTKTIRDESPFDDDELTVQDDIPDTKRVDDEDSDMPSRPYLGTSPPGGDEVEYPNSSTSVDNAVSSFGLIPIRDWPRGMRNTLGEFPTMDYELALEEDVRTYLTLVHLCPVDDGVGPGSDAHKEFLAKSMLLFSATGLFARYLELGGYEQGKRPIHEPYNFATRELTFSLTASWYATHGIAPDSSACEALEGYARAWRNQMEGGAINNTEFVLWPHNEGCVGKITKADVTPWHELEHAALRYGLESTHPRRPAELNLDVDMDNEEKTEY
ncbi:hypothetical protein C8R47DRAFT_1077933 [Mycena vitilis]|nr:hypothetical protein C8R47DRAFT_1077933 [Mycena vitilis]